MNSSVESLSTINLYKIEFFSIEMEKYMNYFDYIPIYWGAPTCENKRAKIEKQKQIEALKHSK